MVLWLMLDTCVWLDLAKDHRQVAVISALEELIRAGEIELIVPEVVISEFERNKARVIDEARRGFQSHLRLAREAVNRFAEGDCKSETLSGLDEVTHKMAISAEAVHDSIGRIEALLGSVTAIPTSDCVKRRVTDRAMSGIAPFHRNRNNVADAILIEIYANHVSAMSIEQIEFAFVTHNTKDFSAVNGDRRKPHSDLATLFESQRSTYCVSIVDLLQGRYPELLADHEYEFSLSQQSRSLSEILKLEYLLFRQIWYNRHWNLRSKIEEGKHQIVSEKDYASNCHRQNQTLDGIWEQALEAAKRTEEEVGLENLGPWDDFEWGMINGKLSALRWVLGDEWDMLDT